MSKVCVDNLCVRKLLKPKGSICECGQLLTYKTSPFMTTEKRVCAKCGAVHYVDHAPIEFGKVFENITQSVPRTID